MKVHVHFFQINSSYSQKYADAEHEGKESPDNMKFWWEDAFATKSDVFKISKPIKGEHEIKVMIDDQEQAFIIPKVIKYQLISENEVIEVVVSESILDRYQEDKMDENNLKMCFFLKDDTVITNPIPGQYFEIDDFPKELKR